MTSRRSISTVESIRLGETEQWIRIQGNDIVQSGVAADPARSRIAHAERSRRC